MKKKPIVYQYILFDKDGKASEPKPWNFKVTPNMMDTLQLEVKNGLFGTYVYAGKIFRIGREKDYLTIQFASEVYAEKRKQKLFNDSQK